MGKESELSEISLSHLSSTARSRLLFLLRSEEVDFDERREVLYFPAALRSTVLGAVDEAATGFDPISEGVRQRREQSDEIDSAPVIAGRMRRLGAGLVDALVISFVSFTLFRIVDDAEVPFAGWVAYLGAEWGVVVVPMALTGRPLGARMVGSTVVRQKDCGEVGWRSSVLRWVVAHVPALTVGGVLALGVPDGASWLLAVAQAVGFLAVYGGVFFHALGQGLHDRVASTIVVIESTLRR
jgi:uncharacterized RDD family membrane protein YckC